MKYGIVTIATAILLAASLLPEHQANAQSDERIIFTDPKSTDDEALSEEDLAPRTNAWGVDVMIGDDGFGLGFFYHVMFSEVLTGTINTSFSEAKDPDQLDQFTIFGEQIATNKANHIMRIPFFLGLQYRLFREDIAENFRPFINGGAGPVLLFYTPAFIGEERKDFFGGLSRGQTKFTFGGYLGAGAQFGFDRSSIFGVNVRYYIIPSPSGLQGIIGKDLPNANGFFITLNLGTTF